MSSNELSNHFERKPIKRKSALTHEHRTKKLTSKKVSFSNEKESQKNNLGKKSNHLIRNFYYNENEEENNSIDEELNQQREKQLGLLIEKFTRLYNSKENVYENIIKEIDVENNLVYKGSIFSFDLLILKIKCLIKLLKEKFDYILNLKEQKNYYEVDLYIQKVKNEFKNIYLIINEDSKYEYEILTQNYCKFLFIMAVICFNKEENIRSFNYICLGVNMLKVFFVRQNIASDIETYRIYAKLLIMFINKLISDNNISQSLIYINYLSRICQIALNIIYKNKFDKKYEKKFNEYLGYNFLFLGYCLELKNSNLLNYYQIFTRIYQEAFYFMNKSSLISRYYDKTVVTIEKKGLFLSELLYNKLKEKLIFDKLEKKRKYEQQELLKKQLLEEAKTKEKKQRLKLIASGFTPDPPNLVRAKKIIYNEILTPSNQKLLDKLDDELIAYAYKHNQSNKHNKVDPFKSKTMNSTQKSEDEKKLLSMDIMKTLCHYKMYSSLMSNDFKEFIIKNKKLEFNEPKGQKNSMDKIQKYLNRKMEITFNTKLTEADKEKGKDKDKDKDKKNNLILKTEIEPEYNLKNRILNMNQQEKKFRFLDLTKESGDDTNPKNYAKLIKNYHSKKNRSLSTSIKKRYYLVGKTKENNENKNREKSIEENNKIIKKRNISNLTYSNYTKSALSGNNKVYREKTIDSRSKLNKGGKFIDYRKLDKFVFSRKYFKEVEYFENLTNKELDFQKKFLDMKFNNSKMYFKGYDNELHNNGIVSKDEIYKSFLILHNKATYKDHNYEKEMQTEIEINNKPRIIGNVFKSFANKVKQGKEVRNVMRKVLNKYIAEKRRNSLNKNKTLINPDEIKKKNDYSIMKLNHNIKEINSLLVSKNKEAKYRNKFIEI